MTTADLDTIERNLRTGMVLSNEQVLLFVSELIETKKLLLAAIKREDELAERIANMQAACALSDEEAAAYACAGFPIPQYVLACALRRIKEEVDGHG